MIRALVVLSLSYLLPFLCHNFAHLSPQGEAAAHFEALVDAAAGPVLPNLEGDCQSCRLFSYFALTLERPKMQFQGPLRTELLLSSGTYRNPLLSQRSYSPLQARAPPAVV